MSFNTLPSSSSGTNPSFYELRIFTTNETLKKQLMEKGKDSNTKFHTCNYPDAGFDLFTPQEYIIPPSSTSNKINLEVKCAMFLHSYPSTNSRALTEPVSYYLYPRSSTGSKTNLRLSNSVGIIDSGYRGNLIAVFDNIGKTPAHISLHSRLVQVCSPTLQPFMINVVETENELGETSRGNKGFGSTGK
jgi:dUTP pyrophosphatase